jgi:hypothetical protein
MKPNKITQRTLENSEKGIDVHKAETVAELFKALNIDNRESGLPGLPGGAGEGLNKRKPDQR